jgi:predicted nucleic acid-binding protein
VILLDTNIISQVMVPGGDPSVLRWLNTQTVGTLYLSTISLAELRFGIANLPLGRRKNTLLDALDQRVLPFFKERILAFDVPAAEAYGTLRAQAQAAGKAIGTADGFIAAIAFARGLAVATRDVGPFRAAGLQVIVP